MVGEGMVYSWKFLESEGEMWFEIKLKIWVNVRYCFVYNIKGFFILRGIIRFYVRRVIWLDVLGKDCFRYSIKREEG